MKMFKFMIFVIIITSCNLKNDVAVEKIKFPFIIDNFSDKESRVVSEYWINYGDHRPYYIGKWSDTIVKRRSISKAYSPPPPPDMKNREDYKPITVKGKFDDYIFEWWNDDRTFESNDSTELMILFDTTQRINNYGLKSFPVLIKNMSKDTIFIGYGDVIPIITEAKLRNGKWKPIEEQYTYMCGNGLQSFILPPNEIVLTSELIYSGDYKTKLRIKLGTNYSKEFDGNINITQFESEWDSQGNRKTLPQNLNY